MGVGLYEDLRKTGARIRHPPSNYEWAYEMQIEDLDGNVLRIGSDPKKDQPIKGNGSTCTGFGGRRQFGRMGAGGIGRVLRRAWRRG